jgi:predicted transcriptional regulator
VPLKPYLLRLDDETHRRLKVLAAKTDKSISGLLKEAIKILWKKEKAA